jgi:hypothetical protein
VGQLDSYLAGLELSSGWLVVFDQRPGQAPIAERTQVEDRRTPAGRAVAVIRAWTCGHAYLEGQRFAFILAPFLDIGRPHLLVLTISSSCDAQGRATMSRPARPRP